MAIDNLRAQLVRDEGEILHAYQDGLGFWTIGVGRLIDKRKNGGITAEESGLLLTNDIGKADAAIKAQLPWAISMDWIRQCVLINMAFNLGIGGLLEFKNTLALIKDSKYDQAAAAMLQSKWATQVGPRAKRLSDQMRTGQWQ